MFRIDPFAVGWRLVEGRAVIVHRQSGERHWLNRAGTDMWTALAANAAGCDSSLRKHREGGPAFAIEPTERFLSALHGAGLVDTAASGPVTSRGLATTRARDRDGHAAPRLHRLLHVIELVAQIRPSPESMIQRIGNGATLRAPDGGLFLLSHEAEAVWRRMEQAPCAFVDLLDSLCGEFGMSELEADERLMLILRDLDAHGAVLAVADVLKQRADCVRAKTKVVEQRSIRDVRPLGRLAVMEEGRQPREKPNLGKSPVIRDVIEPPRDVAIVCQYGIMGLADGIESYGHRVVRRLKMLNPDLIVLSGGGRHGLADIREAESVIDRYRDHLPDTPLWVEKHSGTSWTNVQHSLELLMARAMIPRRVFLIGDRARTEKLRLCVWLARRRFPAFRDVVFRVIPVTRERVTWRDWRVMQVAAGLFQVIKESRRMRTILSSDGP